MEWTPSVARAALEEDLASWIPSDIDNPGSRVNRSLLDPLLFLGLLLAALLLELPLPLLLLLLLREEDVGDRYIDLGYAKANQALHPVGHVAPHGLGELGYRFSVLGRQRQVYGGLLLAHLHRDPLGLATAGPAAGNGVENAANGLRGAAAHPDALDLLGSDPGDLRDNAVRDAGGAALCL